MCSSGPIFLCVTYLLEDGKNGLPLPVGKILLKRGISYLHFDIVFDLLSDLLVTFVEVLDRRGIKSGFFKGDSGLTFLSRIQIYRRIAQE